MVFDMSEIGVVSDVIGSFEELGNDREVLREFSEELKDADDGFLVYIGLGMAHIQQGKKLGPVMKEKILKILSSGELDKRFHQEAIYPDFLVWKSSFEQMIIENKLNRQKKNNRSFYKSFYEKAQVGDMYAYRMREENDEVGNRWALYHIIRKNDEKKELLIHFLCMPNFTVPEEKDMSELIYIPCSMRFGQFDYVYWLFRGNENTEETGRQIFVGHFPNFARPSDEIMPPDPLLYAYTAHDNMEVRIESGIRILKRTGHWKN